MIRTIIVLSWAILAFLFKIPSKISFLFGVFSLLVSFASIVLNRVGFGLRATTYAFGFFVIGLISYFLELIRNEK